jgi:hypothetical protein
VTGKFMKINFDIFISPLMLAYQFEGCSERYSRALSKGF